MSDLGCLVARLCCLVAWLLVAGGGSGCFRPGLALRARLRLDLAEFDKKKASAARTAAMRMENEKKEKEWKSKESVKSWSKVLNPGRAKCHHFD